MSQLVGIKLQPTELAAVDELVQMGRYRSRSHVLRSALFELLIAEQVKPEVRRQILMERPTDRQAPHRDAWG